MNRMLFGFDVLDAKLTTPARCKRCGEIIPAGRWCIIIVPSDPLKPVREVVGPTKGWAYHKECWNRDPFPHEVIGGEA